MQLVFRHHKFNLKNDIYFAQCAVNLWVRHHQVHVTWFSMEKLWFGAGFFISLKILDEQTNITNQQKPLSLQMAKISA